MFPHQTPIHASPPLLPYIPCPSNSSRFYHPHNIGWGVQIIKLFIMNLSQLPCYLFPLKLKYELHYPFKVEAQTALFKAPVRTAR
jgi:hypothetical protein